MILLAVVSCTIRRFKSEIWRIRP